MILVLSQDNCDLATEEVLDWIEALGGDGVRLNGEDLNGYESFSIALGGKEAEPRVAMTVGEREISLDQVGAVWLRRWHRYRFSFLDRLEDPTLAHEVRFHLMDELQTLSMALDAHLARSAWLSLPRHRRVNKLETLKSAARCGLDIPATLVTTDRRALQEFKLAHHRVVTKALSDGRNFMIAGESYPAYTVEVSQDAIDQAPASFFPSLFQELLQKDFEVRAFFLDGELYGMAIFSQSDPQTEIDFRHYNRKRPSRTVPYRIAAQTQAQVGELMSALGLRTGSLDFVHTTAGRLVFLEVNPVGQFKMVSEPCNYRLEKRVAERLVRMDKYGRG